MSARTTVDVAGNTYDDLLGTTASLALECRRLREILRHLQDHVGAEFARIETSEPEVEQAIADAPVRAGIVVTVVGGDENARAEWVARQFAGLLDAAVVRLEEYAALVDAAKWVASRLDDKAQPHLKGRLLDAIAAVESSS